MTSFIEGQYVLVFTGTSCGVIVCNSVQHMMNVLLDTYPNPGDPVRTHLQNPTNWEECPDGMPFCCQYQHTDDTEDYTVTAARVMELQS